MTSLVDLANAAADVDQLLGDLPDGADEIAELFRRQGIRGTSVRGDECPLAMYLMRGLAKLPVGVGVWVGHDDVDVSGGRYSVLLDLPPGPREFVRRVTRGHFRDLFDVPIAAAA